MSYSHDCAAKVGELLKKQTSFYVFVPYETYEILGLKFLVWEQESQIFEKMSDEVLENEEKINE